MKYPSLEEAGSMFLSAVQGFVKELTNILQALIDKLREVFGELI